jgi:hypothetical protein
MCGKGRYTEQFRLMMGMATLGNANADGDGAMWVHVCDKCGHGELFRRK